MDWIRELLRLRDNWSERTPATSSFYFERLEPRTLLSADFLPDLMDQDFGDQPERLDESPDLQPLVSFLSSPLEKQSLAPNDLDSRLEITIVDSATPDYQQLIDTVTIRATDSDSDTVDSTFTVTVVPNENLFITTADGVITPDGLMIHCRR